jgi:hypothetical protein
MADTITSAGDVPDFLKPAATNLLTNAGIAANIPYAGLGAYYDATKGANGVGATPFAQINPLLSQSYAGAANLGPASQLGTGTDMATSAGLGSLMAGQNYMGMASNPYAVNSFMSPYMQNVVDQQKRSAVQDYMRQIPGQQAQSTRMGARGGTRDALVQSENNRNLQNSLQGIQATGSQKAYEGAQDILKQGTQFGLQGYNQGINAASTLGQLGAAQFGQQRDALNTQNTFGNDLYGKEDAVAKAKYSDFQNMMNDPQNKAKFMSGIINQIPVSARQTTPGSNSTADWISGIGSILASYFGKKP